MNHFSQANPEGRDRGNIPKLLRRVASTISSLGPVEVHDITFNAGDASVDGNEPSMTVYYELPDKRARPGYMPSGGQRQGSRASKKADRG
jgi:hypothetical protein